MPFRFGVGARFVPSGGGAGPAPAAPLPEPHHSSARPSPPLGTPRGRTPPASRNRPDGQDQAWKPLHATEVYSVGPPSTWYSTTVQSPRSSPTGSASTVRSPKWPRKSSG